MSVLSSDLGSDNDRVKIVLPNHLKLCSQTWYKLGFLSTDKLLICVSVANVHR